MRLRTLASVARTSNWNRRKSMYLSAVMRVASGFRPTSGGRAARHLVEPRRRPACPRTAPSRDSRRNVSRDLSSTRRRPSSDSLNVLRLDECSAMALGAGASIPCGFAATRNPYRWSDHFNCRDPSWPLTARHMSENRAMERSSDTRPRRLRNCSGRGLIT